MHASRIDTAMFWAPWLLTRWVLAFGAWLLLYYNMCGGVKGCCLNRDGLDWRMG